MASISSQSLDCLGGSADEPIYRVDSRNSVALNAALALLLTGRNRPAQAVVEPFLRFIQDQAIGYDHFWLVGPPDEPRAAALVTPNTGRTAMLFISPAGHRRWETQPVSRLIRRALAEISPSETTMVQALLDPGQSLEAETMTQAGMTYLATLGYLQRKADFTTANEPLSSSDTHVIHWSDANRPIFEQTILDTYENSRDCPGLIGMRDIGDIIAGHMATGRFDPQLWTVCITNDKPTAVMLLNELPDQRSMELVYLGVTPSARKCGLARRLVQHALVTTAARRAVSMVLAVDESNTPARQLYESFNFRTTARKIAMIADLKQNNT